MIVAALAFLIGFVVGFAVAASDKDEDYEDYKAWNDDED